MIQREQRIPILQNISDNYQYNQNFAVGLDSNENLSLFDPPSNNINSSNQNSSNNNRFFSPNSSTSSGSFFRNNNNNNINNNNSNVNVGIDSHELTSLGSELGSSNLNALNNNNNITTNERESKRPKIVDEQSIVLQALDFVVALPRTLRYLGTVPIGLESIAVSELRDKFNAVITQISSGFIRFSAAVPVEELIDGTRCLENIAIVVGDRQSKLSSLTDPHEGVEKIMQSFDWSKALGVWHKVMQHKHIVVSSPDKPRFKISPKKILRAASSTNSSTSIPTTTTTSSGLGNLSSSGFLSTSSSSRAMIGTTSIAGSTNKLLMGMNLDAGSVDVNDVALCDLVSDGLLKALHYPSTQLTIDLYSYEADVWFGMEIF